MANKLNNGTEILFRQIHPSCIQDGEPSSDRFRPSERDENMLSVDRGNTTTAAASHTLYTSGGLESAAVFGLSVDEFAGEQIPCVEDPIEESEVSQANPHHALADYSAHQPNKHKNIAKRLKRRAVERGQLYPPVIDE